MNPQIWWYIARASGIIAWLFITASVLWGILLSTKLFPAHRRPAWLLDLHRGLGALSVLFLLTHVGALVADNYVHFDIVDILVPFASEWKTWQVAIGVFAFWGVVIVEFTSLAMKHLPKKLWRGIHFTSYLTFLLTSFHGTFAGTDATNKMYVATTIITTAALVVAVSYRIATRRAVRVPTRKPARSAAPDRRDGAVDKRQAI
ncbi:MAG: sulfoxide reductase heme-binding subunit YedZ [Ilumatobacter sp.]